MSFQLRYQSKLESNSCKLLLRTPKEDDEEIEEANVSPATAKEISLDANIAAVSSRKNKECKWEI